MRNRSTTQRSTSRTPGRVSKAVRIARRAAKKNARALRGLADK